MAQKNIKTAVSAIDIRLVIVGYLQIISPADPRQQIKDAVDNHVRALKKLLKDNNLAIFDKEVKLKQKREKVKAAKRAIPRDIEFVCLKNRYGESNYTCNFKYYAQFDYFVPVSDRDYQDIA